MVWSIFASVLLLWMVVAIWRAVVFVGDDMLESWRHGEDYTDELFGEAVRAGLLGGIVWPVAAPVKHFGGLLYRLAFQRADRAFQVVGAEPPKAKPKHQLDITDELARIPPEPVQETRIQARLRAEADKGREEYLRLNDETDGAT